jgi:hypothetical protein
MGFLNQSCFEISGKGVIEKRDTIVTTSSIYYSLNTDFMTEQGMIVKDDAYWSDLIFSDSTGVGKLIKQDTVVTTMNQAMYDMNQDFIEPIGVLKKQTNRWVSLNPRLLHPPDTLFGSGTDLKMTRYYTVAGKRLFLDSPPTENGDTLIIIYVAFKYFVSDKRLVIPNPVVGDSMIIFYSAYANNLSDSSKIVNLPYEYRTPFIEGAYNRAIRADGK